MTTIFANDARRGAAMSSYALSSRFVPVGPARHGGGRTVLGATALHDATGLPSRAAPV